MNEQETTTEEGSVDTKDDAGDEETLEDVPSTDSEEKGAPDAE